MTPHPPPSRHRPHPGLAVIDEICIPGHFAWLINGDHAGAADFDEQHFTHARRGDPGEAALVLPEDAEALLQTQSNSQRSVERDRGTRRSRAGKVEAMVVHRAQPGDEHGAIGTAPGHFSAAK